MMKQKRFTKSSRGIGLFRGYWGLPSGALEEESSNGDTNDTSDAKLYSVGGRSARGRRRRGGGGGARRRTSGSTATPSIQRRCL
jgi:hypothetical protein